jgi:hypothetical protein
MIVDVISYKTKATARRALTFIIRIFVNDAIAIAVWTVFMCVSASKSNALPANSGEFESERDSVGRASIKPASPQLDRDGVRLLFHRRRFP